MAELAVTSPVPAAAGRPSAEAPERVLVGRDAELAQLTAFLESERPTAVVGEAGIGKTTLIRAAAGRAGRTIHEGGAFGTLAWMPYLALGRALARGLTGDPGQVAAAVERAIGPDLLFVDDLHWADLETRAVLALLIPRVAVVVAVRDADPGADAALALLEAAGAEVVRLAPLDDIAIAELARRVRPELPTRSIESLVRAAGGNPLLVEALARGGPASTSLASAIRAPLRALSGPEREGLELLAVAGRPIDGGRLGPATAGLIASGLARDGVDGLEIRHGLIAEAVGAELDEATRRARHRRLADLVDDPVEAARHLVASGDRAAAAAAAIAALESTTDPRRRSLLLGVVADSIDGPVRDEWRLQAARAAKALGDQAEVIRQLERPINGSAELRASRAALLVQALDTEDRRDEALAEIERARELEPSPASDAAIDLALAESSLLLNAFGRVADALAGLERAAERIPSDAPRRYRLDGALAGTRMLAGRTDQLEAIEASVSAAVAADDGATAASESMTLYYGLQAQRGAAEACDFAARAGLQLADLGYETRGAELVAESAQSAIFAGRLEETVRHVDELLEEPFGRRSRQRLLYNRGYALGMLGRFDDAERTFVEVEAFATRDFDGLGTVLWCWAEASFWSGRPARALEQADAALEITAWNGAEYVLPSVARAWAEVELGKEPSPLAAKPEFACLYGAEPELRGLQSLHAGDTRQATAEFEAAAGMWAGFHIPRELVCRWAAADAVRRSGDLPAAIDRLREVADRSDAIGFEPLSARVRRSLRLAGDRVHAHAQPKPASELLTPREREVLGLVERGLTRIEIARRMGLGRPTVARMLSNAMLKVGAENRLQAIAMAGEGR